jgi:hypothetical protein
MKLGRQALKCSARREFEVLVFKPMPSNTFLVDHRHTVALDVGWTASAPNEAA